MWCEDVIFNSNLFMYEDDFIHEKITVAMVTY